MDPVSAKELATALALFASILDKLGPAGIGMLILGSPLLMMLAFYIQTEVQSRRLNDLWEKHRLETGRLQEAHRQEAADIVRQYGEALSKTTRYYEDNVLLVQNYDRLANDLRDLITTVVGSVEKMGAGIEMLCRTMGGK